MVGRLLVTKAHSLIAPHIHVRKMVLWTGTVRFAMTCSGTVRDSHAFQRNLAGMRYSMSGVPLIPRLWFRPTRSL